MSDLNPTEVQRFEPLPDQRHHRLAALDAGGAANAGSATPERWLEPVSTPYADQSGESPRGSGRGVGRGLIVVLFAASLAGAVVGSGGAYVALGATGVLGRATAAPATGNGPAVLIESDESTVIAAVKKVSPAVVQIVINGGTAGTAESGIVYDARGWILTNKHVVQDATSIDVRLADGRRATGTTYGLDTLTDLAIVKITGLSNLAVAPIGDSASLQAGELAIAIGSPLGANYPDSATSGIVSALGRDVSIAGDTVGTSSNLHEMIQTDAAINPGNSGGPLVDASGRVVGITTVEAGSAQDIGFAIPIDIAKPIMQQALAGEKLSRPYIGVVYDEINQGLKKKYGLPLDQGAWVHNEDSTGAPADAVTAGSPAARAGIKTGDIITRIEGQTIDVTHPLQDMLVDYAPGRKVSVEVYRNGAYLTLMVTLGTRPVTVPN